MVMFDDYVPHIDLGAGLPRANAICNDLVARCECFRFFAMCGPASDTTPEAWYRDLDRRIQIDVPPAGQDWSLVLQALDGQGFHVLWVSRPTNAIKIFAAFDRVPDLRANFTVIYDAEALYAPRNAQLWRLMENPKSPDAAADELAREFDLAGRADILVSVSPGEARRFREQTDKPTFVLGFPTLVQPTSATFEERRDFGFVGPLRRTSPNEDSMLWYAANVMHDVATRTRARLRIAGRLESRLIEIYNGPECEIIGQVADLSAFMNQIRVFLAPTRFAAGLPQKLIDAASAGVPIVATSLLADQLGWTNGTELLVADSASEFGDCCVRLYEDTTLWSSLRDCALDRVIERYGTGSLTREIDSLVESVVPLVTANRVARGPAEGL